MESPFYQPTPILFTLEAGEYRAVLWDGADPGAIFLHGLTGVAEVWGPTIAALGDDRPASIAFDQRGHGHSARPATGYSVAAYVADLVHAVHALGLARPHLVGHSMGARVAMAAAARHPNLFRSVAIVDIGPDQWKQNWVDSVAAFDRIPQCWPSVDAAVGRAGQARAEASIDATLAAARPAPEALRAIAEARLRVHANGTASWLASVDALKQTVVAHRSRGYWKEWSNITLPLMLVRGGTSDELRPHVAERMRRVRPAARYHELAGVGHNIPLLAPVPLARLLRTFWNDVRT